MHARSHGPDDCPHAADTERTATTRVTDIISALWLAIFIIWAISSAAAKRTVGSGSGARAMLALWGVVIGWLILFNLLLNRSPIGPATAYGGLVPTIAGLGFALWARFTIGRNWSALITVQEGHKIVRTGAYAMVRHPI